MLSDIKKYDKEHIFDTINSQPGQLRQNYGDTMRQDITSNEGVGITSIVIAGMGGSALAGSIIKNWLFERLKVPFEQVRGTTLPGYADNHTLAIISSYSGNTAETLQAYSDARKNNCQVICVTAGGKLLEQANKDGVTVLELPKVSEPRLAVFASLKAATCALEDMQLVESIDLRRELEDAADFLDTQKVAFTPEWKEHNIAQEIAQHLTGKQVVIYASPLMAAASYKFKIDINENAKQMAHSNVFSELNHNEMQGWMFPDHKDIASVVLASSFDSLDIAKRIETTKDVLQNHGFAPRIITASGQNHIQQLLYTILLGDYVSAYLAIMNKVDPTPVELVEDFKKKLSS